MKKLGRLFRYQAEGRKLQVLEAALYVHDEASGQRDYRATDAVAPSALRREINSAFFDEFARRAGWESGEETLRRALESCRLSVDYHALIKAAKGDDFFQHFNILNQNMRDSMRPVDGALADKLAYEATSAREEGLRAWIRLSIGL